MMNVLFTLLITLSTIPPTPLIEQGKAAQHLNFDLVVENAGDKPLELESIEANVLGANDVLIAQRRIDGNGEGILVVPNRTVQPKKKLVVFNPFHTFDAETDLSRIRYDLTFADGQRASIEVRPRVYRTKTDLIVPVRGRVLVHDGHDFYSHHRRLDVTGGMTTALGITSNFLRYAYDFVIVDEQGRMHRGDGEKNEDWYGFGAALLAPGDGTVVLASDGIEDNTKSHRVRPPLEQVLKNPRLLMGNHVLIDHGNGELSLLAHLKRGSVAVKTGDRVKQGQKVGEMGFSGDAFLVHLHYQLQSDAAFGEGLPSAFRDFRRLTGKAFVPVKRGQIDSGDVIESTAR